MMVTNFPHESESVTVTFPVAEQSTDVFEHDSSDSLNPRFLPRRVADPESLDS